MNRENKMPFIWLYRGFIALFTVGMLASSITSYAGSNMTMRLVELEPTVDAPRDDSSGRMVVTYQDFSQNPSQFNSETVIINVNFSRLTCKNTWVVRNSDLHYVLFINDQRIMTFNTQCRYYIPGSPGGDFSQSLHYQREGGFSDWLDDPVNDPIHAIVRDAGDGWLGNVVLEGWLVE